MNAGTPLLLHVPSKCAQGQFHRWGFTFPGMWRCVFRRVDADVYKVPRSFQTSVTTRPTTWSHVPDFLIPFCLRRGFHKTILSHRNCGSFPGRIKGFLYSPTLPSRLWGLPSFPFVGNRVLFPRGAKRLGRGVKHSRPSHV